MLALYINIIELLVLGFVIYNRKKFAADIYLILSIYIFSAIVALLFDPTSIQGFQPKIYYNDWYFIIYGFLVVYSLSPLYFLANINKRPQLAQIKISKQLKNFMLIGGIGALYAVIYQLPYAIASITLGAAFIRNNLAGADKTVLPENIFSTIAVAFSTFFPLYIVFLFISIKEKLPFVYKFLMFMGSISYLISSFCFTARDGVILYIFFILILATNFWQFFSVKMKRTFSFVFVIVFVVNFAIIFAFTQSRFGNDTGGTIGYIAEQPYVFAKNVEIRQHSDAYYGMSLRFPLITNLTGSTKNIVRYEPYEWTFGTFLADFYNVNGFFTLFLFTFLFVGFFRWQLKNIAGMNPLAFLVLYILYAHFIISGIFYFRLGTFSGNIYLLVMIGIYFYLKRNKTISA